MTWITDALTSGTRNGSDELVVNDCGAGDVLASKVRELLAADAAVAGMFKAIERWPLFPESDNSNLPKLQVYLAGFVQEPRPTLITAAEIEVFIGLRFDVRQIKKLDDFECSYASVIAQVDRVLKAAIQLADTIPTAESVCLATLSREGPMLQVPTVDDAGREARVIEMSRIYEVTISNATGLLEVLS